MPTYDSMINRADTGNLIPPEYSNEILDAVAEESHVMALAHPLRRMTRYQVMMTVLSALADAYFINGEAGLIQTSEDNWEGVTLTAEDLAVIVPIPRNLLNDASVPIWDMVMPDIKSAIGKAIDAAVMFGTNKPSTWPTALVTAAIAAGNNVALGTGVDLFDDVMGESGLLAKIEADGYMMTGSIAHTSMRSKLRSLRDTNGNPLFLPSMQEKGRYLLDGEPIRFPLNGSTSATYPLLVGQWNQLVYSVREDMEWEVFTSGVISDANGVVVKNLMQQNMAALRVITRLGFAQPNPVNRVEPVKANRYPFAVLTNS